MATRDRKGAARGGEPESGQSGNGASNPETGSKGAAIFVKKITPRTLLPMKVAKYAPKADKPDEIVDLFAVYGVANGMKEGESDLGPWTAVTGVFEAVRFDGSRFASSTCFLPGAAGELLVASLKANREKDPEASIHFAIQISVKYAEKRDGTDGYEYVTRELMRPEQADVLQDLRSQASGLIAFENAPAQAAQPAQ